MSHLVNPNTLRSGKTFLWENNSLLNYNVKLLKNINTPVGLDQSIQSLLLRNNCFLVKSSSKFSNNLKTIKLNVLYYSIFKPIMRNNFFPRYYFFRHILNISKNFNNNLKTLLKKLWSIKKNEYKYRFIKSKKKVKLNRWITKLLFKNSNKNVRYLSLKNTWQAKFINNLHFYKNKNWRRWSSSKLKKNYKINDKLLSKQISNRVGYKIILKSKNIFFYINKKNKKKFNKYSHQLHFWNEYHRSKWYIYAFYDIINSIFISSKLLYTENLITKLIRYSLIRMSKRRIKIKPFFYFLDKVLKTMPILQKKFNAFKIIVTGKLQGGTSRTKTFIVGFGSLPKQSLDSQIYYAFDNLHSKYGSYGIKLLTWRK